MTEQEITIADISPQAKGGYGKAVRAAMSQLRPVLEEMEPHKKEIRRLEKVEKPLKKTIHSYFFLSGLSEKDRQFRHDGVLVYVRENTRTERPNIAELLDELAETAEQKAFVLTIKSEIEKRTVKKIKKSAAVKLS